MTQKDLQVSILSLEYLYNNAPIKVQTTAVSESCVPGSGIQRVCQGTLYFGIGKGEAILQQPLRR